MKLEALLEEVKQGEKARGGRLPINYICEIYEKVDHRLFLNLARDYIWFGEEKDCITLSMHNRVSKQNLSQK